MMLKYVLFILNMAVIVVTQAQAGSLRQLSRPSFLESSSRVLHKHKWGNPISKSKKGQRQAVAKSLSYHVVPGQIFIGLPNEQKARTVNENFEIQIINLARRQDRWQRISLGLDKQGLRYNRQEAIDGKKFFASDEEIVERGFVTQEALDTDRWMTKGMVALGVTLQSVWGACANSSKPYCIVFEDDFLIQPDLRDKLYDLTKYIGDYPFDVLMLHQNVWGNWSDEEAQKNPYNAEWVERDNPAPIVPSIVGYSAAAYVINGQHAAKKLMRAYSLPLDTSTDVFWWGTYEKNKDRYPESIHTKLTKNKAADDLAVMQTHPLWYKNKCATSSQCTEGNVEVKDSEIAP